MSTKKHSPYGPSNFERVYECPGSVSLCKKAGPKPAGPWAEEGTKAHDLMESVLKRSPFVKEDYTPEMFDSVKKLNRFVQKSATELENPKLLVEEKADLTFIDPEMFGTLDIGIVEELGTLHVIDFKYGKGYAVNEKRNWQMIAYALAVAKKFAFNFFNVKLTIFQPRAFHTKGVERTETMSIRELMSFIEPMKKAVKLSKKKDAPLATGKWCFFCDGKDICPAQKKIKNSKARDVFDDEDLNDVGPGPRLSRNKQTRRKEQSK